MSRNNKKLDYYSFFCVEKCLEVSESSAILLVSFNLYSEKSGRPKEGILKISQLSDYNKSEAENQKRASRLHPCILQMYHYQILENACFFFSEYCRGLNLAKFIENSKKLPGSKSFSDAYTLKSIIKSIKILHSAKLAHRDIKLDNFFITYENYLKLGDFGSSKPITNDQYQTVIRTEGYKSPQIIQNINTRDPFKDDIWAFGALFIKLLVNSKINLDGKTQKEVFDLIISLDLDEGLKNVLRECLQCDEKTRKTSEEVYDSLKSYCYALYEQLPQEITEKDYYKLKNFNFQASKTEAVDINQLKIAAVSKNRCVLCKQTSKPIIFYRQFHRVHPKCLFVKLSNGINLHRCVVCNIFDLNHRAEDIFRSLGPNHLIPRNCLENLGNPDSPKCNHFLSALNDKYQSVVYICTRTKNQFCPLCPFNESHIHCVGYTKHLRNYEKKYIISQKNTEKVVLKKYKLMNWQKKENEPVYRQFQIMKKFQSNENEIGGIHIHEFLSSISGDFVKVDFWFEKNRQIFAFYEYMKGKTLRHEVVYRESNGLGFLPEEIELFSEFRNRVLETMHKHFIYHTGICLEGIYVEVNSSNIIEKFKLGKFRRAELFGGIQEDYEDLDKRCFEDCLAQLSF